MMRQDADRAARYRQALDLLGPALAADPRRLEVSAAALLALGRYRGVGQFGDDKSVEGAEIAAIPVYLPADIYGMPPLLAESETANVVWLPPHRPP